MFQSRSSGKKLVKPLKYCFCGPNLHRKEVIMGHAQDGRIFFGRNNKSRSSAFKKFLFYQNIICFDWVMNLFPSWVMLSVKKVSFPVKTSVNKIHFLRFLCMSDKPRQHQLNIITSYRSSTVQASLTGWIFSFVQGNTIKEGEIP